MAEPWTTSPGEPPSSTSGGSRTGPELLLALDREAGRPLRGQLERRLRDAIRDGRLRPGARLPSTRTLAADLGLSRGAVVEAYAQLTGEGYLEARRGSGTRVAAGITAGVTTAVTAAATRGAPAGFPAPGGPPVMTLAGSEVGLPGLSTAPAGVRIDFRPGLPDLASFPRAAWAAALRQATRDAPSAALGYGDPAGTPALCSALAAYLGRVRGVAADPGGVLAVGGFSQALALLVRVLPSRYGNAIALEDPGSPGVRDLLTRAGVRVVPAGVDSEGVRVEELAASGARVVLVTPAHQFPTGVVLSPARRAALLVWARERDGLILEDDYDAEFRYDRAPTGALQGLAPDLVCYAGSVSKTLAPALRLGWMVPPPPLFAPLAQAKRDDDHGSPTIDQLALANLLESGAYDRHLRRNRAHYRRRRDALITALHHHTPTLEVRGTAAGLHALVQLPPETDEPTLIRAAATAGIGLYGLASFHHPGRSSTPGLVLGYAALTEHQIQHGIRVLSRCLCGQLTGA